MKASPTQVISICLTLHVALSPISDQHQISPCNNNTTSTPEVMRIKEMINQDEFS